MSGIAQGEGQGSQGEASVEDEGFGDCEGVGTEREGHREGEGADSEAEEGVAAPRPLYGSIEAVRAIWAARRCEKERTWDDLPDSDDEGAEAIIARRDAAEDSHLDALLELRDAFFPQANLCCEGHMGWRRRRCPCGMWRPPWPWMVHSPRGYDCQCWKAAERLAWETMHALHDPHHGLRGRAACV